MANNLFSLLFKLTSFFLIAKLVLGTDIPRPLVVRDNNPQYESYSGHIKISGRIEPIDLGEVARNALEQMDQLWYNEFNSKHKVGPVGQLPGAMVAMVDGGGTYCVVASSQTKKGEHSGTQYKHGEERALEEFRKLRVDPDGGVSVAYLRKNGRTMPACDEKCKYILHMENIKDVSPLVKGPLLAPAAPKPLAGSSSGHGAASRPASPSRSGRVHRRTMDSWDRYLARREILHRVTARDILNAVNQGILAQTLTKRHTLLNGGLERLSPRDDFGLLRFEVY